MDIPTLIARMALAEEAVVPGIGTFTPRRTSATPQFRPADELRRAIEGDLQAPPGWEAMVHALRHDHPFAIPGLGKFTRQGTTVVLRRDLNRERVLDLPDSSNLGDTIQPFADAETDER